jgi:hypothetical protein
LGYPERLKEQNNTSGDGLVKKIKTGTLISLFQKTTNLWFRLYEHLIGYKKSANLWFRSTPVAIDPDTKK